jgi:general secretion pathway protein F
MAYNKSIAHHSTMTIGYSYRAATAEGEVVEGVVQAASRSTALEELRRQRLYPIDVAPVAEAKSRVRTGGLPQPQALAVFGRTVATMLSAGVTLERALAFASEHARNDGVARAGRQLLHDLQGGASLAEAMARQSEVFTPLFIAMVTAGEESGALDEAMTRLADHLDELVELRSQIRSALIYPLLMSIASGAGTALLLLFVVPRFGAMLQEQGATLPWSTRLLVGLSLVLVHGWWLILLVAVIGALALRSWLADDKNRVRLHAWRLRWPLAGELESKYQTARFARSLGMLLRSGRPVLSSLRAARVAVSNLALAQRLDSAADAVSHGKRVHTALAGTLPPLATELIAVGEESGRLDELCLRVAESYDLEVRRSLRNLVAVIEPAMILLFGLLVGFVALAMLQAIYGFNINPL